MRMARLLAIGAIVAATLTASAEARPHGWDRGHGYGYGHGHGGYGGYGGRGHGRRICRVERYRHHRVTRCFYR